MNRFYKGLLILALASMSIVGLYVMNILIDKVSIDGSVDHSLSSINRIRSDLSEPRNTAFSLLSMRNRCTLWKGHYCDEVQQLLNDFPVDPIKLPDLDGIRNDEDRYRIMNSIAVINSDTNVFVAWMRTGSYDEKMYNEQASKFYREESIKIEALLRTLDSSSEDARVAVKARITIIKSLMTASILIICCVLSWALPHIDWRREFHKEKSNETERSSK